MPAQDLYLFADDPESEVAAREIEAAIATVIADATSPDSAKQLHHERIQPILDRWIHVGAGDSEVESEVADRVAEGVGKKLELSEDQVDELVENIRWT